MKMTGWDIDPDPFACGYIPVNLQVTRLGVFDDISIRNRVSQMFAVGVLEMYRETLCVLTFKVHNETHPLCSCDALKGVSISKVNAKADHGFDSEPPEQVLATADEEDIERLTYLDNVAYEVARGRLQWDIEYIQTHFDDQFLCYNKTGLTGVIAKE